MCLDVVRDLLGSFREQGLGLLQGLGCLGLGVKNPKLLTKVGEIPKELDGV